MTVTVKTPVSRVPVDVHTSDGRVRPCRLVVRNVTGIAEERGFRLYWEPVPDDGTLIPALGLATSGPFAREYQARAYGHRHLLRDAVRVR